MKIYCAHSSSFDFKNDFYAVLDEALGGRYELIFPHQTEAVLNSKEAIKSAACVIAEVSYPSTGLGIELGWAEVFDVPILALHQVECKPSQSICHVTDHVAGYENPEKLIDVIDRFLGEHF